MNIFKRTIVSEKRRQRYVQWLLARIACLCLVAAGLTVGRAQDCALDVKVKKASQLAYQPRGDRCEGIYDQPLANRINLRIAGFHLGAPVFDPRQDKALQITVYRHDVKRKVLLRVISTRRHAYFQMDTSAIRDDGTFIWPLDVVHRLAKPLMPYHTAALACVSDCVTSDRATLLPVSFSPQGTDGDPPPSGMTVFVLADVELASLTATLRQGTGTIFEDAAVGRPPLPPHKPIRIPIKNVEGEALLSLLAVTRSGRRDHVEAVLLIPERGK